MCQIQGDYSDSVNAPMFRSGLVVVAELLHLPEARGGL